MLQKTTEHSVRDKVLAILQTAGLIALVAAIVLGSIFFHPALAGAAIFYIGLSLLSSLSLLQSMKDIEDLQQNQNPTPLTIEAQTIPQALLVAPVLPLYEAFTRKSRLEKAREKLSEAEEECLNEITQQIGQIDQQEYEELVTGLEKLQENLKEIEQKFQDYEVEKPSIKEKYGHSGTMFHKGLTKEDISKTLTYVNHLLDFLASSYPGSDE